LTAVVERHDVLRSRIATIDGRTVLVADRPATVNLVWHDVAADDQSIGQQLDAKSVL